MDNSESKENKKNRKVPNKSLSKTSSKQKENVPKNEKHTVIKSEPDDAIAKSKLMIMKKNKARTTRQSKRERVCPNGKPIPSLSVLKKMFEDSDDDNDSDNRNNNTTNLNQNSCTSPPPDKLLSNCDNKTNQISPSTIKKISEKMVKMIENISDPRQLLEELPLESIDLPLLPLIPPKKRKKPEVPYIVGCKDRPQVPSRASTNFCKGGSDYGVSLSGADLEEEEPNRKRAKKSSIKNYSKSSFNNLSDVISKQLTERESGNLSDCSSDSNKTIEYDVAPYTLYQPPQPRPFSPLPSTSRDRETFIKNDELFNESLKMEQSSPQKEKVTEHSNVKLEETPVEQQSSQDENDVEIIDIPYETIVIDEYSDSYSQKNIKNEVEESDLIQIIEPEAMEVHKPIQTISNLTNDDDRIIITNETVNEDSRETIIIEDDYSSINDLYTLNDDEKYDINVDDIINENKFIINKWKNKKTELSEITTVIEVPDISSTITTPTLTTVTDLTNNNSSDAYANQNESIVVVDSQSPQTITEDSPIDPRLQQNLQNQQTIPDQVEITQEVPLPQSQDSVFKNILDDFFRHRARKRTNARPDTQQLGRLFESFMNSIPGTNNSSQETVNVVNSQTVTNNLRIEENRPPQQTTSTPQQPSPEPKRSLGDCPICLDSLTSNGIASTLCGHVFCVNCIKTAIRQNGKKCPTCRKALKGPNGGYHLLYL